MKERILLVDDDWAIRRMLARLLGEEGYCVTSASSGVEALERVNAESFDLVLLDLNMPVKDGWETYEQLALKEPLTPVVVITARPNQHFTALAAGIGALMEKPLDLSKLTQTIRELLDEPDEIRIARLAGRPADFHYVPPTAPPSGNHPRGKKH